EQMREFIRNGVTGLNPQNSFTFRVTCNRAGEKSRHSFSSMDAAKALGAQINNIFGWRPDMKNFDMEVVLNIRNDSMSVMVALNKESLFKRNVCAFGPTTMRSTMCYCMTALARPSSGDVIIDPMCGGGSIPLEAALAFPGCLFVGTDLHPKALERVLQSMKMLCERNS
ncbi:THUMP domain protein, partial [Ancylostoma duodenale]